MNLFNHYNAYQPKVEKSFSVFFEPDELGVVEHTLAGWADINGDRTRTLLEMSEHCIHLSKTVDETKYKDAMEKLQLHSIKMCVDFVKYFMEPWELMGYPVEPPESRKTRAAVDLIAEKGWEWFKFYDRSISATLDVGGKVYPYELIPRYEDKFCKDLEGKLYLDADEASFAKSLGAKDLDAVMPFKSRSSLYKILKNTDGSIGARAVNNFNNAQNVRDWTINLFPY